MDGRTLSPVEAAYLAGILDGEGSVSLVNQRDVRSGGEYYRSLICSITNTDQALGEWVLRTTGLSRLQRVDVSSSIGTKPRWTWRIRGETAAAFLRQVEPYMVVKRDRALLAIAFQDVRNQARRQTPTPEAVAAMAEIVARFYPEGSRGRGRNQLP